MNLSGDSNLRDAAVDRAISMAGVHRRRGAREAAWRCLDDALAANPNSAVVLEMMGDLNYDDEEWAAASRCYERALELDPGRAGAEAGHARCVIALARQSVESALDGPDGLPVLETSDPRKQQNAAMLSVCVPGLGQMWLLEFGRGAWWLLAALPGWYLGFMAVLSLVDPKAQLRLPLLLLAAVVVGVVHGWAAWDAWQLVDRLVEEDRRRL